MSEQWALTTTAAPFIAASSGLPVEMAVTLPPEVLLALCEGTGAAFANRFAETVRQEPAIVADYALSRLAKDPDADTGSVLDMLALAIPNPGLERLQAHEYGFAISGTRRFAESLTWADPEAILDATDISPITIPKAQLEALGGQRAYSRTHYLVTILSELPQIVTQPAEVRRHPAGHITPTAFLGWCDLIAQEGVYLNEQVLLRN